MVQSIYEENLNFKKARQPFDDLRTENCSRGPEGAPSIADRMNKMGKILALMNSPYEGEALSAARLAMKLVGPGESTWGCCKIPPYNREEPGRQRSSNRARLISFHHIPSKNTMSPNVPILKPGGVPPNLCQSSRAP